MSNSKKSNKKESKKVNKKNNQENKKGFWKRHKKFAIFNCKKSLINLSDFFVRKVT